MSEEIQQAEPTEEQKFDGSSAYITEARDIFQDIAKFYPVEAGKAISKKEREELSMKTTTLVYGEIGFDSFAIVFEKIKRKYGKPYVGNSGPNGFLQRPGGKFYDLGSGTGKPVIAAAILHNFDVCVGIEILEGLYSMSLDVKAAYDSKGKARLPRDFDTEVQMVRGDFLNQVTTDWTDADIVFANSTCYDDDLMQRISDIALQLKKGAFFISFTKRLPAGDFLVLEYELHQQSWGASTVYIMQKTTDPRTPGGVKEQA